MSRENDKSRLFTRRAVLIGGMKINLISLLIGRLYYLQILQKQKYSTLAEDNRINASYRAAVTSYGSQRRAFGHQPAKLPHGCFAGAVQKLSHLLDD